MGVFDLVMTFKDEVEDKGFVDVGSGIEKHLGASKTELNAALHILERDNEYVVHSVTVNQKNKTPSTTVVKILTKTETTQKQVFELAQHRMLAE